MGGGGGHGFRIWRFGIADVGSFDLVGWSFFEFFLAGLGIINEVASQFWVFVAGGPADSVF